MKFSTKLKTLLETARRSQQEVADTIGVSQGLVSNWVRGKGLPDLKEGLSLARAFGVSLVYLADEELTEDVTDPRSSLTEDQRFVLELVDALGLNKREAARRLAVARPESIPADEGDRGQARLVQG